jgi:hypothetical protein
MRFLRRLERWLMGETSQGRVQWKTREPRGPVTLPAKLITKADWKALRESKP